jgi:hypothetical protein
MQTTPSIAIQIFHVYINKAKAEYRKPLRITDSSLLLLPPFARMCLNK